MLDPAPLLDNSVSADWITHTALTLVSSDQFSLLELVTDLGPVLTHSSAQVRVHGVGLLSSVLSHDHVVRGLSQQELDVIFTFYIDR